jgi:hypothetical protein
VEPRDPRVVAVATALVWLIDALAPARSDDHGDELVLLNSCGIERRALRRLAKDGRLEVVRLGRKLFTTRRSLAALVRERAPGEPKKATTRDAQAAARAAYAAPLRVVGGRS